MKGGVVFFQKQKFLSNGSFFLPKKLEKHHHQDTNAGGGQKHSHRVIGAALVILILSLTFSIGWLNNEYLFSLHFISCKRSLQSGCSCQHILLRRQFIGLLYNYTDLNGRLVMNAALPNQHKCVVTCHHILLLRLRLYLLGCFFSMDQAHLFSSIN